MPELMETDGGTPAAQPGIVVAATFTAEPIEDALRFWMRELGTAFTVDFAPYSQVFQSLLDPGSAMRRNPGGYNVVLVRLEDWRAEDAPGEPADVERKADELVAAIQTGAAASVGTTILGFCPGTSEQVGAFDRLEQTVVQRLASCTNVYAFTSSQLAELYPVAEYEDKLAHAVGHVPYTVEFFAALGTMVMRRIAALSRPPYKVIALDCDNTLWSGVCGEDGARGVRVTPAHAALQRFMLEQRKQGMLLCLCSKNNENDVWEVFEQNAGMVMTRGDISAQRIDWERKSANLRALAAELNLGLDSFIFLDDNPVEIAEVQAGCPEILTLQIPEPAEHIPHFIEHVWAFDRVRVTETDRVRGALYEGNRQREQMRQGQDLDSFLRSLHLEIDIAPLREEHVARVAELTQRSNQFNCRTVRYRVDEIRALLEPGGTQCLVVHLRDRFGDYGLIGVLMYSLDERSLVVENFLMSCRALGRRVELTLLERVATVARAAGKTWVDIRFSATQKNKPALEFLESLADTERLAAQDATIYRLDAGHIALKKTVQLTETDAVGTATRPVESAPTADRVQQSVRMVRIAAELSTASAILNAIEAQRPLGTDGGREYKPPQGLLEESIAAIWAKLLRQQRVGRADDFFLSGGHSLLATQMMSRVGHLQGVRLSLADIFDHPTLQAFAQAVRASMERGGASMPPLVPGATRPAQVPLSYGQQRLWFLDQWHPGSHVYNVPMVFRVRGKLRMEALRSSLNAIVARHEALRTTFHIVGEQAAQRVHAEVEVPLRVIDMRPAGESADRQAMDRVSTEMRRPFHLATDVMLRAVAVQVGEADFLLGLCVHHIAADGWSLDLLCRELSEFYADFAEDRIPAPEALPIQFADYAVWQRSHLEGPILDEHVSFWRGQLEGAAPQLKLPTDKPRPATQAFRGALLPFTLAGELAVAVAELCRSAEVTTFIALLTVLQIVLRQYCGQDDISIGSPIANRTMLETEGLIGFFANTMVYRTVIAGDPTFRQMLARVRETALGVYKHQHMPFERLVETLKPARATYNPLFQVNFRVLTEPSAPLRFENTTAERVFFDPGTARFDLALELLVTPDRMEGFFEYSTDLFYAETIERLKVDFARAVDLLTRQPDASLSSVGLAPVANGPADRTAPVLRRRAARPVRVLS